MGFWSWQLQVWRRAVKDARRNAIPHTFLAAFRLGAVLVITTVSMLAANEWFQIVDRGLMSADSALDNFVTLAFFVPFSLFVMFVGLVIIEGLFLVPYKLWREAERRAAIHAPSADPFGAWDWSLEQMSVYLRSRGIGSDSDYSVCFSLLEQLKEGRVHIEGRQGDPSNEATWSDHFIIVPTDWRWIMFDELSFEKPARLWRTRSQRNGIPTYVDMRVRSAQVLKRWPPGVGQSVADTIKERPRVWVRHLVTDAKDEGYRHIWEVKIRSAFAPPPLKVAVQNASVLRFVPDLSEYSVEDEKKFYEIEVVNPPPKFTFYADTVEPATPQIACEFIT
jgi:hypothetical protein